LISINVDQHQAILWNVTIPFAESSNYAFRRSSRSKTGPGRPKPSILKATGATRMGVEVAVATTITDDIVEAFVRLLPQLSPSAPPPSKADLQVIADHDACDLLIARDTDGSILGSMTLILFPIPTGWRGWIEDVVVDEAARGKGVGELLNRRALDIAQRRGAKTVDLTSRPSRVAANKLYQKLGFVQRETNVYRFAEPSQQLS
jgi:ribosomal protein S18 acetylase RimI-like enzyme